MLAEMVREGYGKKRMTRETQLSYNTVKTYLTRMAAETTVNGGDVDAEDEGAAPRVRRRVDL